jgi:hypothetical protein
VADTNNHNIRKIVITTGEVSTLAGSSPGSIGAADGTDTSASFKYPGGITTDGVHLYVADTYNHTIRKIVIASGDVSTLAGMPGVSGTTDATGNAASFQYPFGLTTDGVNLFVADTWNNSIRKIVIASGEVSTLAGSLSGLSGSSDATGTAARFNHPRGITTDGIHLYVADTENHTLRMIVIASADVSTLAGTIGSSDSLDGTGTAAMFNSPAGLVTDGISLYLADTSNNTIRKIVAP